MLGRCQRNQTDHTSYSDGQRTWYRCYEHSGSYCCCFLRCGHCICLHSHALMRMCADVAVELLHVALLPLMWAERSITYSTCMVQTRLNAAHALCTATCLHHEKPILLNIRSRASRFAASPPFCNATAPTIAYSACVSTNGRPDSSTLAAYHN